MAEKDNTSSKETSFTPTVSASHNEPTYTKLGLRSDESFSIVDRDIINIVLKDDKKYTLDEVKSLIKKFKEGI